MNRAIFTILVLGSAWAQAGCSGSSGNGNGGAVGASNPLNRDPVPNPNQANGNPVQPAGNANDPALNPNQPPLNPNQPPSAGSSAPVPTVIVDQGPPPDRGNGGNPGTGGNLPSCQDLCSTVAADCSASCMGQCNAYEAEAGKCPTQAQALLDCVQGAGIMCSGTAAVPNGGACTNELSDLASCAQGN